MKVAAGNSRIDETVAFPEMCFLSVVSVFLELLQLRLFPTFLHIHTQLMIVLYFGWYATPGKAAAVGTVLGIIEDYIFGLYLGLNGLSKTLLAFTASYASGWIAEDVGFLRILVFGLAVLADRALVFGTLHLLGGGYVETTWLGTISNVIINAVIIEIFFRVYDRIRFPPTDFRRLSS